MRHTSCEETVYGQKVSDLTGLPSFNDRFAGVVEAQQSVDYKKDASRTIAEIYVTEGQMVETGERLFRYDVHEAENAIANTSLEIEGYYNQINIQNEAGGTEAALEIARLQVQIQQAEAQINRYRQEIANAEVPATISGIVKSVNENGGVDQNGSELPVVSVMMAGDLRVKGKVSEQSFASLSIGMPVIIRSRTDETLTWQGTIEAMETEPVSDSQENMYYDSGERASSYPFYVSLENTEGLMLGQHVFIENGEQAESGSGIRLDASFIAYQEDGTAYVWLAKNGRLVKKTVVVSEVMEDYTVIVEEGLEVSDMIVYPDESLKEGMKAVQVNES